MKKRKEFDYTLKIVLVIILCISLFCLERFKQTKQFQSLANTPYAINIIKATENNSFFRKVLFTGTRSQLVVMSIPPGGDVGEEVHKYTEQTLFFLSGTGEAVIADKKFATNPGDVVVVPPGTKHNFINTGVKPLKIYTVYSPPNHLDGRVHVTKHDADLDTEDEAFGEKFK